MLQCSCYKYGPSIMVLTLIGPEKYHKVSEACHKVDEAKKLIECIHGGGGGNKSTACGCQRLAVAAFRKF